MANDLREKITEWLTGADTFLLLGSGCSVCAGKPMMRGLTEAVLKDADEGLVSHFQGLKSRPERQATIEDLMNYLVRYREILGTISSTENHSLSMEEIDSWLDGIKRNIVNEIADDWKPSKFHQKFLVRMVGQSLRNPREIFSLNYDTTIEASLDEVRTSYVDGFRGTNRAWFDPSTFDDASTSYRLYKLHGSINWTRDEVGHVRRGRNANEDAADEPVIVYPTEQKYLQTQFGVYETMMSRFRDRLRSTSVNNCLVVLGYSFNDAHVNEAIADAITTGGSNLTVIAFIGPDDNREHQIERMEAFGARCDARFNAFIGDDSDGHFVGCALDEDSAKAVLDAELWRFENLVEFLAGEAE